jgi:hypothetical protein
MRSQSHEQFVMSSEVEPSRYVAFELCHGIESLVSRTSSGALQPRLRSE